MSESERKPRVFIGSSAEALAYVNAVHEALRRIAEVTPWSAGTFDAIDYTMESLEVQLNSNDFAVFICSPDDIIEIRGKRYLITRDNTLFEMGLFWGRLRRGRVFFIIPDTLPKQVNDIEVEDYHFLSDLIGITPLVYEANRSDCNPNNAVNSACGKIITKIQELKTFEDPYVALDETKRLLAETDDISLFVLGLTKELLDSGNSNVYDYLTDNLRNVYATVPGFNVTGVGLWKKEKDEGLKHVAGKVGKVNFYKFDVNKGKKENQRIHIVHSFINSKFTITLTKDHLYKTYLICYPIGKELLLTITMSGGRYYLMEEDKIAQEYANNTLIQTINYLFGGAAE